MCPNPCPQMPPQKCWRLSPNSAVGLMLKQQVWPHNNKADRIRQKALNCCSHEADVSWITLRDPDNSQGHTQERASLLSVLSSPAKPSRESPAQVRSSVPRVCLLPSSFAAPRCGRITYQEGWEIASWWSSSLSPRLADPEASSRESRMHREDKAAYWIKTKPFNSSRPLALQFLSNWSCIFRLKCQNFHIIVTRKWPEV